MYKRAQFHATNSNPWPPRSIPILATLIKDIATLDKKNFKLDPNYSDQHKSPPPWSIPNHKTNWFPMSKNHASSNQTKARAIFTNITTQIPPPPP